MNQIPYRKGIKWAIWKGDLYAFTNQECVCVDTDCIWGNYSYAFSSRTELSDADGIALAKVRGFEVGPEPVEPAKPVTIESLLPQMAALMARVETLEAKQTPTPSPALKWGCKIVEPPRRKGFPRYAVYSATSHCLTKSGNWYNLGIHNTGRNFKTEQDAMDALIVCTTPPPGVSA